MRRTADAASAAVTAFDSPVRGGSTMTVASAGSARRREHVLDGAGLDGEPATERLGVGAQIGAAHGIALDRGDAIAAGRTQRGGEQADAGIEIPDRSVGHGVDDR